MYIVGYNKISNNYLNRYAFFSQYVSFSCYESATYIKHNLKRNLTSRCNTFSLRCSCSFWYSAFSTSTFWYWYSQQFFSCHLQPFLWALDWEVVAILSSADAQFHQVFPNLQKRWLYINSPHCDGIIMPLRSSVGTGTLFKLMKRWRELKSDCPGRKFVKSLQNRDWGRSSSSRQA